jgi:hypothetical protein
MSGRGYHFMKLNLSKIDSPLSELLPVMDRRAQLCTLVFASLSLRIYPASRLHRRLSEHRGQSI